MLNRGRRTKQKLLGTVGMLGTVGVMKANPIAGTRASNGRRRKKRNNGELFIMLSGVPANHFGQSITKWSGRVQREF
jgi:hypothetical protein